MGRGALAGPLVVAAVILPPTVHLPGLDDCKRLTPRIRQRLAEAIRQQAVAFSLVRVEAPDVDRLNVLQATKKAMLEAINDLGAAPGCVVSDAVPLSGLSLPVVVESKADSRYLCVAAASVLAKVARDRIMTELAAQFPQYGWERNKGYPTSSHREALRRHGPSPWHRRSFAPVRVLAYL